MAKPVIVLAPGAWHPVSCFNNLTALLTAAGYETQTIVFPAVYRAKEIKEPSLEHDITAVRAVVESLILAGREIVLVMHSWGGFPASSALEGLAQGVRHLVYMAAFVPGIGQRIVDLAETAPPSVMKIDEESGVTTVTDPVYLFYHDIAPNAAQPLIDSLLPHALTASLAPATAAAYRSVPSTYILCAQDRAISLSLQEKMVAAARADGAKMETVLLDTSHTPWMADPQGVLEVIKSAACY